MPIAPIPPFVQEKLGRGEVVRWLGKPSPFPYAILATSWRIFFFGFAAVFSRAFFQALSVAELFLVVPFVLAAISMMLNPLYHYYAAWRTLYVVTNKRALIFGGAFRPLFVVMNPPDMGILEHHSNWLAGDTVVLWRKTYLHSDSEVSEWVSKTVSFTAIKNGAGAFAALQKLKQPEPQRIA